MRMLGTLTIGLALALTSIAGVRQADAGITKVTVDYTAPFPSYNGKSYTYTEATVEGTVSREDGTNGTYNVGMVLIYPQSGGNDFAIVDWPNTVYFSLYYNGICPRGMPFCDAANQEIGERLENFSFQLTRAIMDDYMWNEGYTYISIGWDKTVTDFFGNTGPDGRFNRLSYGSIERGADGYAILADAARWVKNPTNFNGGTAPTAVSKVISTGFSETSGVQNAFIQTGGNDIGGATPAYDGFLLMGGGFLCWFLQDTTTPPFAQFGPCDTENFVVPSSSPAKKIVVSTQSDVEAIFAATLNRGDGSDPDHIQYEVAGVSHVPVRLLDATFVGATRQNPQDANPFMRGALNNLTKWIRNNTQPPPTVQIEGDLSTFNPALGGITVDVDADGNALGGLRPPGMPTTINGMPAGAPLGVHTGVEFAGIDPFNIILLISGTFEPFSDAEIMMRYPTKEAFVALVTRSADDLLAKGYIIQADRDAYIANASATLPMLPPLPPPPDPDDEDGCCSSQKTSSTVQWGVLALGVMFSLRRRRNR